jgi:hypothetical protein
VDGALKLLCKSGALRLGTRTRRRIRKTIVEIRQLNLSQFVPTPTEFIVTPNPNWIALPRIGPICGLWFGLKGLESLACLRKAIPEWDERIEKERFKQVVKEAPNEVGPGQGKRTDKVLGDTKRSVSSQGTTAPYLTARLKRDAPDIADCLERGEFKSVRAAAINRSKTSVEKARRNRSRCPVKDCPRQYVHTRRCPCHCARNINDKRQTTRLQPYPAT